MMSVLVVIKFISQTWASINHSHYLYEHHQLHYHHLHYLHHHDQQPHHPDHHLHHNDHTNIIIIMAYMTMIIYVIIITAYIMITMICGDHDVSGDNDYVNGLVQDCSNSIAKALELLQSCTKPLM